MYIEKKKIGSKSYFYLKESERKNGKVKTKTIAYLGKSPMNKKELKKKIETIKEKTNEKFLTKKQLEELEKIKKNFASKIKKLDVKLVEDMFKDFKTHYIYNTTAIEGNTLTLGETNLLLNENKTPEGKDLKEIYDHINEKETFDWLMRTKPKLNLNLIINVHSKLLKNIDNRTGIRTHNVRVFGATFETSDAKYIRIDLELLMNWYKDNKNKLNTLILSAVFHEKFERIHPFYDGNGRTGRMISNLILLNSNFPPLIIKNKTRLKYYQSLSKGHESNLTETDIQKHKAIVLFFYKQIIDTHKEIFAKWG
ncbi:hypothetical protein COV11_01745 [Candidatus Woesearchaeota archaeon CG10_big_fil_rev_8_21_14_0_10_30_7]|nr:MAG: hypothetical protein COV11_01745 [Candidatus Woesearchaeota archaeon CG10_big_fil_rev_8_21_14_0_10_30_7]